MENLKVTDAASIAMTYRNLCKDFINVLSISILVGDDSTGRLFAEVTVLVLLNIFPSAVHAQQLVVLSLAHLGIQIQIRQENQQP